MSKKLVLFAILALILFALSIVLFKLKPNITGTAVYNEVYDNNGSINIFFCPRDNCSSKLTEVISLAKVSIDCALFDLNLESTADALSEKANEIPVRVVFDNNNKKNIDKLEISFEYKFDTNNQLSHNKFCVIDNKIVFTGSMNPTLRDTQHNNNNILIINSAYFAQNYADEFKELWYEQFGTGKKVKYPIIYLENIDLENIKFENYFCPEDKCEQHVIKEVRNAKHTVYFMTFSFTSEQIADAILTNKALVDVKGIFEKSQNNKYNQYERLKGFGLNVRWDNNKYNMHHKVFIIDNETVITGSYNPTSSGDERNDENMLIIHDNGLASQYLTEFVRIFAEAK